MKAALSPSLRAVIIGAAIAACALVPASPSMASSGADPDAVAVSPDGTGWGPVLDAPLFDEGARWVPGDGRDASFWVRNDGGSDAALEVVVHLDDRDGLVAGDSIRLSVRALDGSWMAGAPETHVPLGRMASGESQRIDMRAILRGAAGDDSQSRSLGLSVAVGLSSDPGGIGFPVETKPDTSGPAGLAITGGSLPWGLVGAATALVAIGLAAYGSSRGRRE
ncbi:hypothetical protein C5C03_00130 [Clavibacter michiganensis]|uniref:hypothetical protein n=1 Tax=Clavibacter michiganensis TaxID=28447 RepID=UPI000CE89261|nr:hypothetical protein [Clavibacter michiganensis]PPF91271.1 hypothetical protein C5C03_00130 [Clavibacter michiganensis]PPF99313.1 hypothetical protein C5C05_01935 [Clavibacter michiganensis]